MEYEQIAKRYVCRFCKGSFDQAENMHKHVQQIHTVRTSTKEHRTCSICGVQCQKSEDYRNHLRHIHGLNDEGQVISFKCFNDFLLWKNETEKRNYCKFVMRTVPKVFSSNDKVHLYQCDSSGSKTKEKKGFVAVKDACPAMISAIESAKTRGVKVEYWNNHLGHPVPVEDDELDAAINSLQDTEIILGDDQRFQSDSAGNIYILAESNEVSISEDIIVNEVVPKAKKSLFMKNNNQSNSVQSKPDGQKFSFRKDPSKKIPSFQFSLASVACMKPKPKPKKPEESVPSVTAAIENDNPDSSSAFPASPNVESIVESTEPTEHGESRASSENPVEDNTSTTTIIKVRPPKAPEKEPIPTTSTITSVPTTNQSNIPNLNLMSDGIASGQYIILNSVPGENGVQNLLLCPVSSMSSNPSSSVVNTAPEHSEDSSVIFISPTGEVLAEKENTSSVQNVLTVKSNTPLPEGVGKSFLPSGKSLLKKPKPKKVLSKKLPGPVLDKTFATSKHPSQPSSLMKDIKSISTLAASNRPAATFTPILVSSFESISTATFVSSASTIPSKPVVVSSAGATTSKATPKPTSSVPNRATAQPILNKATYDSSGNIHNVISFSLPQDAGPHPQIVNNNISGPIVGQTILPSGQMSFMAFNNNLIPIGSKTPSFISPNLNPGFVIPVPSPVVKNQQPPVTSLSAPPQPALTSGMSNTVSQILSSIGKTLPANAVPIIILPNGESPSSMPPASFGSNIVNPVGLNALRTATSSVASMPPASFKPNIVNPVGSNALRTATSSVASMPIIISGAQSLASPHTLKPRSQFSSPVLPGGAQVIPVPSARLPCSNIRPSSMLPQTSKSLLKTVPKTTSNPCVSKPLISTTVSNGVQVQRVHVPPSSAASHSNIGITSSPVLQTNTLMSPVVLNSDPISSTPAIDISSVPMDKSGTMYFKSAAGSVYMLQPVEDGPVENSSPVSVTPNSNSNVLKKDDLVKTAQAKTNIPLINIGSKNKTFDKEVTEKSFRVEQDKSNIPVVNIDVDENENAVSFNQKVSDSIQSHLDIKSERKLKPPSPRKTPEFRNGVQIKSVVQEKRPFKEDDVEILKKVKYYQMEMKFLSSQAECKRLKLELAKAKMKNEALTKKDVVTNSEPKEATIVDEKSSKPTNCKTLHSTLSINIGNVDINTVAGADSEQTVVNSIMENIVAKVTNDIEFDDEQPMDIEVSQITGPEAVQSVEDEIMEAMNAGIDDVEEMASESASFDSEIQPDLEKKEGEAVEILDSNQSLEISELAQQVVDANNPEKEQTLENMLDEQPGASLHREEEPMSLESLKSLEDQYGQQSSLNIYTMIRTSVLRNLYEDTKGLCEENKKLFEELQNYRAHGQLYGILDEEL